MILTRRNHNCPGIAFIQKDSAGGSKLIEQTLIATLLQSFVIFSVQVFPFLFRTKHLKVWGEGGGKGQIRLNLVVGKPQNATFDTWRITNGI